MTREHLFLFRRFLDWNLEIVCIRYLFWQATFSMDLAKVSKNTRSAKMQYLNTAVRLIKIKGEVYPSQ